MSDATLTEVAARIGEVSPLWRAVLRSDTVAVTPRAHATTRPDVARGVESIYEGYLLHFGQSRLLASDTSLSKRLLVGDHSYAAGLCDVAATGDLAAVRTLSDLIADVAVLAGDGSDPQLRETRWHTALAELAGDPPAT